MNKAYEKQTFVNNSVPALNETNLNNITGALDEIDNRVVDLYDSVTEVIPKAKDIVDGYDDIMEAVDTTTENAQTATTKSTEANASALQAQESARQAEASADRAGQITNQYITNVTADFEVVNHKLGFSSDTADKLTNLDSDGELDYTHVKNTPDIYTKSEIKDIVDEWHNYNNDVEIATVTVADTSTVIEFHELDTTKAYDLYFETPDGSIPLLESSSLNGTTLSFTVKATTVPANFKLRTIK